MGKYIRTLTIQFDALLHPKEVTQFRGAVIASLKEKNILFHNHDGDDRFRYSYPLIQYKSLLGKATIVCIEEGADIIGQFMSEASETLKVGRKEVKCEVARVLPARILVQTWKRPFKYRLNRWLPLNSKNYLLYQATEDENERKSMLENILKGNLLSMLKGLGIHLEDEILVVINQLSEPYIVYNKGVALMAFNAEFTCNLSIPNNLGVGKNASIGCGIIHQERPNKSETKES